MYTLDHSRYRDIDKFIESRLPVRSHQVSHQPYGVHGCFFNGGLDQVLKMISDSAIYFFVANVTKGGLDEVR